MRAGTTDGVVTLRQRHEEWDFQGRSFQGQDVNVLMHQPDNPPVIFAGTYGNGLFRSIDNGEHWEELPLNEQFIRSIVFAYDDFNTLLVGTEPANLYRSTDGGKTWTDREIRRLPGADKWSLPYSPRSGALRSLAMHPQQPSWIYGAVEQGGVIKSVDDGQNWTISGKDIHPDVHCLSIHPADPNLLFAATGKGLYLTPDGGKTWNQLLDDYTRAVAICPTRPHIVFAGPAADVGEGGRILFSRDGGKTWREADGGLDFPMADMVELFIIHPDLPAVVFAIMSEGALFYSSVETVYWRPLAPEIRKIQSIDLAAG